MTPRDDIRDLLGRYATGPLTAAERERLFEAALNDQNLFEELAREQELKMVLDQPGARDRMIRALHPPARRVAWILSTAVAAALSIVVVAFLMHPRPKPAQIAVAAIPAPPTEIAQTETAPAPTPVPAPKPEPKTAVPAAAPPPAEQPAAATDNKDAEKIADKKEAQQVQVSAAAPAVPRAQQFVPTQQQQQQTAGGPRQLAVQGRAALMVDQKTGAFGFHYSLDTKGHLIIVPAADGYLFVTSGDGAILFARKQIAAAITTDIPLSGAVKSITVTFSTDAAPVESTPAERAASNGVVEGTSPLAIKLGTNP
jgi:hypothetical protein